MELLHKLEKQIITWIKDIPHLPATAQKWLGDNIWWIVLIGAILTGISALFTFISVMSFASISTSIVASYYPVASFSSWALVTGLVTLAFTVAQAVLLAVAVKPLQLKQKKGWVLLFITWLLSAVSVVVGAVMTLNPFGFIVGLIFGAIGLAITGYFLFEVHNQFAHVEKSRGVKTSK